MTETKSPDNIMAEYLLKGGKMLAKTCPVCYSPLFEFKGETFCVVCNENKVNKGESQENTASSAIESSPVTSKIKAPGDLKDEFEITLHSLLLQARNEKDGKRLGQIMNAVKAGAQAYALLFHG